MPADAARRIAEPQFSREQARAALRGFFAIMALWGAGNAEARGILCHPPARTFF